MCQNAVCHEIILLFGVGKYLMRKPNETGSQISGAEKAFRSPCAMLPLSFPADDIYFTPKLLSWVTVRQLEYCAMTCTVIPTIWRGDSLWMPSALFRPVHNSRTMPVGFPEALENTPYRGLYLITKLSNFPFSCFSRAASATLPAYNSE